MKNTYRYDTYEEMILVVQKQQISDFMSGTSPTSSSWTEAPLSHSAKVKVRTRYP